MTDGQRAVLANEYRETISKYRQSKAGKKARNAQLIEVGYKSIAGDEETVSSSLPEYVDRSRTESAKKFNVPEWDVRKVQKIKKQDAGIYEKVRIGDLQLHDAKRIVDLPEEKRNIALERKLAEPKEKNATRRSSISIFHATANRILQNRWVLHTNRSIISLVISVTLQKLPAPLHPFNIRIYGNSISAIQHTAKSIQLS